MILIVAAAGCDAPIAAPSAKPVTGTVEQTVPQAVASEPPIQSSPREYRVTEPTKPARPQREKQPEGTRKEPQPSPWQPDAVIDPVPTTNDTVPGF